MSEFDSFLFLVAQKYGVEQDFYGRTPDAFPVDKEFYLGEKPNAEYSFTT
jgi:hypothetical protein